MAKKAQFAPLQQPHVNIWYALDTRTMGQKPLLTAAYYRTVLLQKVCSELRDFSAYRQRRRKKRKEELLINHPLT